jgi:hypothetical protein
LGRKQTEFAANGSRLAEVAGFIALSHQLATKSNICDQAQTCKLPGNFGKPLL